MTNMWKMTDVAGSSPIWGPAYVKKHDSRANANTLYGNTTANAYNRGTQSGNAGVTPYPTAGVFAVQPSQMNILGDGVNNINIANTGSGALAIPTITFIGGLNNNVSPTNTATATVTALVVSATANNSGNGYSPSDHITVTGGTGTAATFNVATTKVSSITPTSGQLGTGYVNGNIITILTGTGTAANATVVTGAANTSVASLTLVNAGSYTVNPTLANAATSNTTGTGSGLQVLLTMGINQLQITNTGAYSALPTINAAATSNTTGTGGTTGTLALSFGAGPTATITANGSGYEKAPLVNITANGLVGAFATANLISTALQQGVAHTGWVLRKVGTGGRAGRVQTEVLVAGRITGTANNTTIYPVA